MPHLPEDPTMLHINVDEKNQSYVVRCQEFQPPKQRFNWKKYGKLEALVLAKKARDNQVEKRKHNAQLQKERELAEEAAEEAYYEMREIERIKRRDLAEEEYQKKLREKNEPAVMKLVLPDDLDEDRKRLVKRDLFCHDYKYFYMNESQLLDVLPILINSYNTIQRWDRDWLENKY